MILKVVRPKGRILVYFYTLMHSEGENIQPQSSDKNTSHRAPHASINVWVEVQS